MKKLLTAILMTTLSLGLSTATANAQANGQYVNVIDEREDIKSLVKEMDYMINVTKSLQKKYGSNKSRITFNYQALIQQLQTTRNRTAEYLNTQGQQIHSKPPIAVDSELLKLK